MTKAVLVCALLIVPAITSAQSDEDLIAEALMPLPDHMKDDAAVVMTDAGGHRRVIREGKTELSCSPDGPAPGFSVSCISGSTGTVIPAYTSAVARGESPREAWDTVNAAIKAGTLTTATPGGLIFIQSGETRTDSAHLAVVLVPYATAESTGLPVKPTSDRAWLMCPGTPRAHIMIGTEPYGIDDKATWTQCLLP